MTPALPLCVLNMAEEGAGPRVTRKDIPGTSQSFVVLIPTFRGQIRQSSPTYVYGLTHVYSLIGGLVPGSSAGSSYLKLLFFLLGCNPRGTLLQC